MPPPPVPIRNAARRAGRGALLAALIAALPAAVSARSPKPPLCPPGRYLVAGDPLVPGDPAPPLEVVEVDEGGRISIASGCPAVAGKVKATRKGTKVRAKWERDACPGLAGKPKLAARIDPTCVAMTGKLKAKRHKRRFEAALSRCGDGVDDAGEVCPLLEGPPDGPALDHVHDVFVPEGVPENEIDEHNEIGPLARTQLEIGFEPDATVAQVNAAIGSADASILAMLEDALWIVVRVPDPGSVEALEALAAALEDEPGIAAVALAGFPEPDLLPSNYLPPISGPLANIDHHLAVRGAAAWNARSLVSPLTPPLVVVSDWFGGGAPLADFDIVAPFADFGAGNPHVQGHGYHVLGIVVGSFGGSGSNAGLVTGAIPGTVLVRAADWIDAVGNRFTNPQIEDLLLQRVRVSQPGPIVANTSWSSPCSFAGAPVQCPVATMQDRALRWIQKVRGSIGLVSPSGLEERFLHVTSAGNVQSVLPADTDSHRNSQFVAAALLPGITGGPFGLFDVPNLTNVVVVENVQNNAAAPFAPLCLDASSKRPGDLAGIGTGVWSMTAAGGTAGNLTGTSMAAPQVAGFAAWLWSLRPAATPVDLAATLQLTAQPPAPVTAGAGCDPASPSARVLDAYAALLSADAPGNAPVRSTILDQDESGSFDEVDVEAFLDAFADSFGSLDWSRHDLNGDGATGAGGTAPIDLDIDEPPTLETVQQTSPSGAPVSFDETAVTDIDVLCYYAYSPLYAGDPDQRDLLLEHACGCQAEYALTKLGGVNTEAYKINDAGAVIGFQPGGLAFLWTPLPGDPTLGAAQALPPLAGSTATTAHDINASSDVVGHSAVLGTTTAVIWEGGVPRAIGPASSTAVGLSDSGLVAGRTNGVGPWVLDGATTTFLGGDGFPSAINDAGAVAGSARSSPLFAYGPGFWPSPAALPILLAGSNVPGVALDLNDAGLTVGYYGAPSRPFVSQSGGVAVPLPAIPGGLYEEAGQAHGVNERGEIVGQLLLTDRSILVYERAGLWRGGAAVDLNMLLSPADAAGFWLLHAFDINERGQIVGYGIDVPFDPAQGSPDNRAFLLTPSCSD